MKIHGTLLLGLLASSSAMAAVENQPSTQPSAPIPIDQLGAVAGKQYQGDGLSVTATSDGARLRCAFQRLEGQLTHEGLWLSSTAENSSGERFRVVAAQVGRTVVFGGRRQSVVATPLFEGDGMTVFESSVALRFPPQSKTLPAHGAVVVNGQSVQFIRDGLTEEYSVSADGVRQDFIIDQRPAGEGELRVELDLTGAKAEPLVTGVRLVLGDSGRKLAYNRLRVVDARGQELAARLEVKRARRLLVMVDDSSAVYPVRIDPTFSDANWFSLGGVPGTESGVHASVVDAAGNLYIGGEFIVAGNTIANRIAKWDGSGWTALGGGLNGVVRDLAMSGSDVYVGGEFTIATNNGGVAVLANRVAKWNGNSWSALGGGLNNNVQALTTSGSDVYAGGVFTTATNTGGTTVTVNRVARWDGNNWSALGLGMNAGVRAAAVSGSDVYVGGDFTVATNGTSMPVTVNRVAKWDGNNWSALGAGADNFVYALAVSGSDLFAGGEFTTVTNTGGVAVTVNRVARWNGSTWTAMETGMNGRVSVLATSGSDVYAGGYFTSAGASTVNYIGKWNGSTWSALGSGMDGNVYALSVWGDNVYAGGAFKSAGGGAANYIAKWNGSTWLAMGVGGMNNSVFALAVSGSDVYAGGYFTTAGGSVVNCIAKWDGNEWSALGLGMNSNVQALAVSGTNLYAGGEFTRATNNGGVAITANRVARWNGSSWSALGSGLNGVVRALTVSGSELYAGGEFTMAGGSHIARWTGSSWSPVGGGVSTFGYVNALASSGSDVYAGGIFGWVTNSGLVAVRANYIAKWNGSSWSALGSGLNSTVRALAVSSNDVYAGGLFVRATNTGNVTVQANYIAKWDGNNWSGLASGMNFWVYSLAVSETEVYAGGWFTRATNSGGITVAASAIARWDGTEWSALGSGLGGSALIPIVDSLAVSDTDLYVGGSFSTAGGKVSGYAARASFSAIPLPGVFSNLFYAPSAGFSCAFADASVGVPYRIQTAPSLVIGPWTDFTNFTYAGPTVITDLSAGSGTNRFFRAVTP